MSHCTGRTTDSLKSTATFVANNVAVRPDNNCKAWEYSNYRNYDVLSSIRDKTDRCFKIVKGYTIFKKAIYSASNARHLVVQI